MSPTADQTHTWNFSCSHHCLWNNHELAQKMQAGLAQSQSMSTSRPLPWNCKIEQLNNNLKNHRCYCIYFFIMQLRIHHRKECHIKMNGFAAEHNLSPPGKQSFFLFSRIKKLFMLAYVVTKMLFLFMPLIFPPDFCNALL